MSFSARQHEEMLKLHNRLVGVLAMEGKRRDERPDTWIEDERHAVTVAANEWAMSHGMFTVTVDQVESVEQLAVGHIDYAHKLALYVAEMVYGQEVSLGAVPCEFCGERIDNHTPSELKSCAMDLEASGQAADAIAWWRAQQ